jgi:hypothetical protein
VKAQAHDGRNRADRREDESGADVKGTMNVEAKERSWSEGSGFESTEDGGESRQHRMAEAAEAKDDCGVGWTAKGKNVPEFTVYIGQESQTANDSVIFDSSRIVFVNCQNLPGPAF